MNTLHLLPLVIAILAVIQSIFGMGILVFGTPTLLLLGFDFASVLGLLLPASMSISLMQVWTARNVTLPRYEKINMLVCGLLVVGLWQR